MQRDDALSVLRRMTGYDIDRDAIAVCRKGLAEVLAEWYPDERVEWNLQERTAFDKSAFSQRFRTVYSHSRQSALREGAASGAVRAQTGLQASGM